MNIQFSFKHVAEKDKKFLQEYISKKEDRLKTLLSDEDYENAFFEIKVEKFAKKEAFKIELFLKAPHVKLMASEDDHTVNEAFDLALDKLIIQLRKAHDKKINN